MAANFFHYSIYDRLIQIQPCACMRAIVNFFFKKTFPEKLLTGVLPTFSGMFLRGFKTSLHCYRKIRPVERYRRSTASSSVSKKVRLLQVNTPQQGVILGKKLLEGIHHHHCNITFTSPLLHFHVFLIPSDIECTERVRPQDFLP